MTGSGIFIYNKMKPFFLSSQLMQMNIEQDMEQALDLYFLKMARDSGKECFGVEKFSDQIRAVDARITSYNVCYTKLLRLK